MDEDKRQLESRVAELEKKVEELSSKKTFEIKYPMDEEAIRILNRYFLRVVDIQSWAGGVAGRNGVQYVAQQEEVPRIAKNATYAGFGINKFEIPQLSLFQVDVDPSTDKFTMFDNVQNFDSGAEISFLAEGDTPAGLNALGLTNYKINNLDKLSDGRRVFSITDTSGVAINITDTGSGRLFMQFN